ncbi:Apple domain-containing protein [Chloropicon primus]|uniref:Apple domain-containing protein n=2 Tax=Chloropicon primus TaxID=1764295 RepID=A0A5B8MQH5_9CHLO|nr:hypothetical protein A3770_07p47820 [Chloropicon primus]UPR01480.1 Apple domain-containing protein [Chloropicon primus]|eukprot:QDZ22264.1 hypothetical protein A3770_07p47820 [Chloropicon primus]
MKALPLLCALLVASSATIATAQQQPQQQQPRVSYNGNGGNGGGTGPPRQRPRGTRPPDPEPEPSNLFDNLWNIAQKTVSAVSDAAVEADPENAEAANAWNVVMNTAGSVGSTIVGSDPGNAENKGTVEGAKGFVDNLGSMSGDEWKDLVDSTITDLTSDKFVQQKAADTLSGLLGAPPSDAQQLDLGSGGYYDYYDDDGYYYDGDGYYGDSGLEVIRGTREDPRVCEVEYNANYEGELLSEGKVPFAESEGECCSLCRSTAGCNTWVYCGEKTGCGAPYYEYGQCYLKKQDYPENRKAYERGDGVYWTSGIVRESGYQITKKSYSDGAGGEMGREVLHVSGVPATWRFDNQVVEADSPMTPRVVQCGSFNVLPGVASYNKDFNMRIEAPAVTRMRRVLLVWSDATGSVTLPSGFKGSPCGQLPLGLGAPKGSLMATADREGSADFILDGINKSSGTCHKFLYQYVDLATCKVSALLDSRSKAPSSRGRRSQGTGGGGLQSRSLSTPAQG